MRRHRDFRLTDLSHLEPQRHGYISGTAEHKGLCACGIETSVSFQGIGWICPDCKSEHVKRLMQAAKGANG